MWNDANVSSRRSPNICRKKEHKSHRHPEKTDMLRTPSGSTGEAERRSQALIALSGPSEGKCSLFPPFAAFLPPPEKGEGLDGPDRTGGTHAALIRRGRGIKAAFRSYQAG